MEKLIAMLTIVGMLSGCGAVKNLVNPEPKTTSASSVLSDDSDVDVKDDVQENPSEHYTVRDAIVDELYFVADGYFSFLKATLKVGLILTGSILGIGLIACCCCRCLNQ